jgi:hypothetical protein
MYQLPTGTSTPFSSDSLTYRGQQYQWYKPSLKSLGHSLSYSLIGIQGTTVEAVSYDDAYFLSKPHESQSRVEEENDHLGSCD